MSATRSSRRWIAIIAGLLIANLLAVSTLIAFSHGEPAHIVPGYGATPGKSP
jgi:hypothetical protein